MGRRGYNVRLADLAQIAADFFVREGVQPNTPIIVACSGGPDSTALAHVCAGLFANVTLVHVDHGLRPGSERESSHVAALAERIGARAHALTV
jgi:tRNA(Ile)-lysidine synthase